MSDDNLTPQQPSVPTAPPSYTAANPSAQPAGSVPSAPAAYAHPDGAAGYGAGTGAVKKGLALTSFILGIASVALFVLNWIAAVIGLVAVILGFIARSREPGAPRWMWLTGIILGFIGIIIGVVLVIAAIALASYMQSHPNFGR
jgi:hypothetical protein